MKTKPTTATHCPACGLRWSEHMGISGTCAKLTVARAALQFIRFWATHCEPSDFIKRRAIQALKDTK
jgi:hypothetical protein